MRKLMLTLVALMILGSGLAAYSMQEVAAGANAQQASADLHQATRIAGNDRIDSASFDGLNFPVQNRG